MEVTLKIANSKEPAAVYISGSMTFKSVKGLDEYMRTVRTARNWLATQKRAAPAAGGDDNPKP